MDDGLPNPPGRVTNLWTVTSGPSSVAFSSKTNTAITATFTNLGTYLLRCMAGDGQFTDYDETTVYVQTNSPPVIRVASAIQYSILNTNATTVSLSAFVTDDGLPNPPGYTTNLWSQISGPGTVIFSGATNLNATATFPTNLGTYVLQLFVSDSAASATTNLTFTVISNLPTLHLHRGGFANAGRADKLDDVARFRHRRWPAQSAGTHDESLVASQRAECGDFGFADQRNHDGFQLGRRPIYFLPYRVRRPVFHDEHDLGERLVAGPAAGVGWQQSDPLAAERVAHA